MLITTTKAFMEVEFREVNFRGNSCHESVSGKLAWELSWTLSRKLPWKISWTLPWKLPRKFSWKLLPWKLRRKNKSGRFHILSFYFPWKLPSFHESFHGSFHGSFHLFRGSVHGSYGSFHGSLHELSRVKEVVQETVSAVSLETYVY